MTDSERKIRRGTKTMEGIPHLPGTDTYEVEVGGETIHIPADHDGSRIKVERPDGSVVWTDGFDPAVRALAGDRAMIPCGNCGRPQVLTGTEFTCSACGARNSIAERTSADDAAGQTTEGA